MKLKTDSFIYVDFSKKDLKKILKKAKDVENVVCLLHVLIHNQAVIMQEIEKIPKRKKI